jgi:hypothetical protein
MVNTLPALQNLMTDTWIAASWEEFLVISEHPTMEKARCYYDSGLMRVETMPIGFAHGRDNSTLASVVTLYGTLKNISFLSITNGSFRKKGERECLVVQKSQRRLKVLGKGHFSEFNTSPHSILFLERGTSRRRIGSWQACKRG